MLKVLLVDDEEEVRQGIRDRIDWNGYGFAIAGEAENGMEALSYLDDFIPDVVVTDINMPFMDGLELTSEINRAYPTVRVVILTGFDDFKFAQTAIKHGVYDYLLKPVLPDDINKLLLKLKESIEAEKKEKEDIEKLRKHYHESLPLLRENFLVSLILGRPDASNIKDRFNDMKIRLHGKWFAAALCKIDSESLDGESLTNKDIELKRFAVFSIISELLDKRGLGEAFIHDDGIVIIMAADCDVRSVARNKMISFLDAIRQTVCKFMTVTVSIGLGKITREMEGVRDSYQSAITARKYKLILSGNKIIFVEDLEPGIGSFFHLEESKEDALISNIKFKGQNEIALSVNDLFKKLDNSGASLKQYQLYFVEIISSLMKLARLFSIEPKEVVPDGSGMKMEFDNFDSIDEARDWIYKVSMNLHESIASRRSDATTVLYDKARTYIENNYGDPDLNIQKLSDILYISPSYLSLIFKKKSKKTFLKFLVEVRLSKAREFLLDKNKRIADIAVLTGYPDVSYFSYFFKKNTGLSPREFRKNMQETAHEE